MPMVYRSNQWKRLNEEELRVRASQKLRPISTVGGGRGGSLMAITEVARAADGR